MPIVLDGTQGISTPMYAGSISSNPVTPSVNMKNRIINGNFVIDQRNAGASVTMTTNLFTLDRWAGILTQASKYSIQQNAGSVTPPAGFANYLGVTSLSAYSVGSGDTFFVYQAIEGYNFADLNWGSANAKTITLSFWVRSSLTGTFGGALTNNAADRSYAFTYTISSANTWEQKSITIPGDTSGTWLTNNLIGANVRLGLGSGSTFTKAAGSWGAGNIVQANGDTSVVGTNGATWFITGVQLEVGSTATSFDYRPYGTELQLCQRYFEKSFSTSQAVANSIYDGSSYATVATDGAGSLVLGVSFCVSKRANPTVTFYNPSNSTANSWRYARNGVSETDLSMLTTAIGTKNMVVYGSTGAAWSAAYMYGQWTASAEL